MTDDEEHVLLEELTLSEVAEVCLPSLSVNVDFNDLFADKGDDAFEIIAKLRDLLA